MIRKHSLKIFALISVFPLALGSVACSGGSSPTEPADFDAPVLSASTSAGSAITEESKGRGRGGRGGRGGRNGGGGNGGGTRPAGQELEGAVASVGQNSLTLTNGTRIIVNGQTQWIARGDLHSLSAVARSVDSGNPTRVEARGTRQGNGDFVARTIKAEVDN